VLCTGSHLGVRGGIDRPGITAVGGEINAAHAGVEVAACGEARQASKELPRAEPVRYAAWGSMGTSS
jgi:hypothetical protein